MGSESSAPAGRVLLVGCGYMGSQYLKLLVGDEIRCDPETIAVVDRDPKQRVWCSENVPRVRVLEDLQAALDERPSVVFNITNTPEHFDIFRRALSAGVRAHFVEKPLVSPEHLEQLSAIIGDARVGVGYLINFSGVLTPLFEFMRKHELVAREIRAIWGKDRIGDHRPTVGDLEDEATHPLCTALSIIEFSQQICGIAVQAALSTVPFVDMDAQRRAHREDVSYPETPTATSAVALDLTTNRFPELLVTTQSSFISFAQERRIEVSLADDKGELRYVAQLSFDVGKEDHLRIRAVGTEDQPASLVLPEKREAPRATEGLPHVRSGRGEGSAARDVRTRCPDGADQPRGDRQQSVRRQG